MRCCLGLLLWLAIAAMVAGESKSPLIQVGNPSRDVGTVVQGEIIKQVFVIANKGSATLEILNVTHS